MEGTIGYRERKLDFVLGQIERYEREIKSYAERIRQLEREQVDVYLEKEVRMERLVELRLMRDELQGNEPEPDALLDERRGE